MTTHLTERTVYTTKRFEIVFHTHLYDEDRDITESILTNDPQLSVPRLYEDPEVVSYILMDGDREVMHHNKRFNLPSLNQPSIIGLVQILGGISSIINLIGYEDLPIELQMVHVVHQIEASHDHQG